MKHVMIEARSAILALGFGLMASGPLLAEAMPGSFADIVDEVSPAVVNIATMSEGRSAQLPELPDNLQIPEFFRDLLENNPQFMPNQGPSTGIGSGYIIDVEGYVVTNNHVVEDADEIRVQTYEGDVLEAELVGRDAETDVAVLKIEPEEPLHAVSFGDSDAMRVGDWVIAVGNPLGHGFSVSSGIVSARSRSLGETYDDYIQTDAAINRGNSGGPLFNTKGEVIGMNTAIVSPNGGSVGIGFAMSSRVVSNIVEQLREKGEVRRAWLGIEMSNVSEEVASALELEGEKGALVRDLRDGPAEAAGLKRGDVILTFDGKEIEGSSALANAVAAAEIGKPVPLTVKRFGEKDPITIEVTLAQRARGRAALFDGENAPEKEEDAITEIARTSHGLSLIALDKEKAAQLGVDGDGVVVSSVEDESPFADKLRPGDIIREMSGQSVRTVKEVEDGIKSAKDSSSNTLFMVIERQGNKGALFIELG